MSLDAFSSSSDYLNNPSTSSSTFAQPSQPQPQPQPQSQSQYQTQIAMPVGTLIPSTASESSHLKRTTSSLCISSLAAQQSALHPNVSFALPSPISDEERHGDQMYYSHEEYTIDPNPVEEEQIRQRHRHRGDSSRSRSPSRSRSVSFSSLSTTSSSSSFDMNRSFSSSSTATSDYDDDDDEDDNDDDDDEESSVTSLSLSNTSRSSKHSATSTSTSFSSSRPQRPIFFLPPIYDCDEDEYPIIDTLPIPSSSLRSPSSSPRTRMRRQSKINKKARSINLNLTPTPATITRKYVQTTRSSSLFPLVDEPREELDALIDKIDRLGATTCHVGIGKDAFLELMIPSSEWQGDDYDEEDEEASSCRDCALDSAPSRSISISRPSSLSLVGNNSPVYHTVREGEDPLTATTPRLNAVIPVPEQRRRTHSRSSSISSASTITSASSPATTHSSPSSPISSSPSFSSICCSPLQTFLHPTTSSSPPLVVEPEDKPAKECQLVTYIESRSVIFPEPSPSPRSFVPISDYISLPPPSCTFSSDLPKLRPTRFSTPWQHLSRTSAQRALLAPRTSVRARTGVKVIKHDERVGRWSWGGMSVFSGEKGTDSFLPGPGDFLDMTDDDDEYVRDDDEDSDEEDDDDDDEDEDEDESLFDFDVSLHPKLRSRSQPETASPPTRPIDSFLLPSGIPLPPLPFHPYFSPSYPTITKRKYVHRTRQASDPLFHRLYALENITAMKRRISPPRPFMDPELVARMRMRMHYYGYSSRCRRGSHHHHDNDDDDDDGMIIPELEEIMMYGGIRWRSEIHRIKLLDRHRPLYTLYNNAWSTSAYDGGRGDVEEEVIREGLERKCEIGRWVALNPGRLGEDGRLRVGSSLRNVAFGPGAPDV